MMDQLFDLSTQSLEQSYTLWRYKYPTKEELQNNPTAQGHWSPWPIDDRLDRWIMELLQNCAIEDIELLEVKRYRHRWQIRANRPVLTPDLR